jgi:citronellol/citronellal dehydrogenase
MDLKGQVAIVTGASRGIGKGIVLALAKKGVKVVVAARTGHEGARLPGTIYETAQEVEAAGGTALALQCDITNDDDVEAMVAQTVETFGRVDLLVNNAGVNFLAPLAEMPMKRWDLVMNVNLRGAVLCSKAVIPQMQKQGSGQIIHITSVWGRNWVVNQAAYCVSKAAIERLTLVMAEELRPSGILVNCFGPAGGVLTEGVAMVYKESDKDKWRSTEAFAEDFILLAETASPRFSGRVLDDEELRAYVEYAKLLPDDKAVLG